MIVTFRGPRARVDAVLEGPSRTVMGGARRVVLAALVLLIPACSDSADPTAADPFEPMVITGTVLTSTSEQPIQTAHVVGTDGVTGTELFDLLTPESGSFQAEIPAEASPASLVIRVTAQGHHSYEESMLLQDSLNVELKLEPLVAEIDPVEPLPEFRAGGTAEVRYRISDLRGDPIPGVQVSFEVPDGNGTLDSPTAETDTEGLTRARWTLNTATGQQELHATADSVRSILTVEAHAGPPNTVEMVGGDAQVRLAGTPLPEPLEVVVRDEFGNPVPGEEVTFRVKDGGGTLSESEGVEALATTGEDGLARMTWTLGDHRGSQAVEVLHPQAGTVEFYAEALEFTLALEAPAEAERFLADDDVPLRVRLEGDPVPEDSVRWVSSADGIVGNGSSVTLTELSSNTHTFRAQVLGAETDEVSVRVFDHLWDLYRSEPAPSEIARIKEDFDFVWVDGDEPDEKWDQYGYDFNPETNEPSKLVIISNLDVLRRQRFEERPTFIGDHETVYDWFNSLVHTIRIDLGRCGGAAGGGGRVTLSRTHAHYGLWLGGDTCDTGDQVDFSLYSLGILIHEARHSEPDDPRHMTCSDGRPGDRTLEGGSGYAWYAKYAMWVYRYSKYDPPLVREIGDSWGMFDFRRQAINQLRRICEDLSHSDPRVQAIVDELMDDT